MIIPDNLAFGCLRRKKMEKSEKVQYEAFDALPDVVYICDVKHRKPVFVNRQFSQLTGYSLEDIESKDLALLFEAVSMDDGETVAGLFESIGDSGDVIAIAQMSDGSYWQENVRVIVTLSACLEEGLI